MKYPREAIYYSPHSRSIIDDEFISYCALNAVNIIESDYSVEIDYPLKKIKPVAIFGFGSTALVSLQMIYPNADIKNVFLPANNKTYSDKNIMINNYLSKVGIQTINLI